MTEEKKVVFITGAITAMEKKGELTEITIFDNSGTFFCKKELGLKVGCGYKIGIIDTETKDRYEIVSVEQQIIKEPAFQIPGSQQKMVQMSLEDYKELVGGKHIKIRAECLNAAIKICEKTLITNNYELFAREAKKIALSLEPFFE
jgi:hypothetical protein